MAEEKADLWIKEEAGKCRVGLTDETLDDLGTVKFLSLPSVGETLEQNQPFAEVEAEKAVTEFSVPVAGTVVAVNEAALNTPETLNNGAAAAWLIEISK